MSYTVDYTTMDHSDGEKEFPEQRDACIFAQGIEEDGGSATVTNEAGEVIDHWAGYQIHLVRVGEGTPCDAAGIVFGPKITETGNRE